MIHLCNAQPINELEEPAFTEDESREYVEKVFLGLVAKAALDRNYHDRITRILLKPIVDNIADPRLTPSDVPGRVELARLMKRNVYEFSAAKQYQQAREMSALIDEKITFSDFKLKAGSVFDEYNKNYLRAEFNTAISQTQNASVYLDSVLSAADFPLIQYKTQADGRVRDTHRILHDVILPINHPFWRRYWPPNGWNCRCFTIQLTDGKKTDLSSLDMAKVREEVPDLFRSNPAISGELFDKSKHPYFKVARGDSQLRDANFNLPFD